MAELPFCPECDSADIRRRTDKPPGKEMGIDWRCRNCKALFDDPARHEATVPRVTAEMCDSWREKMDGENASYELADTLAVSRNTLNDHLRGDCECENETEPLSHSRAFGWVSYNPLENPDQLRFERQVLEKTINTMANKYDVSTMTIRRALNEHDIE